MICSMLPLFSETTILAELVLNNTSHRKFCRIYNYGKGSAVPKIQWRRLMRYTSSIHSSFFAESCRSSWYQPLLSCQPSLVKEDNRLNWFHPTVNAAWRDAGSYQLLANDLVLILKLNNDLFIYVKFITLYLRYKH